MFLLLAIALTLAAGLLAFHLVQFFLSVRELSNFLKELSTGNLDARLFSRRKGKLERIAQDITSVMERTKARLDFAEAERQRMEAILRGMSDGVLITDTRGVVLLANYPFKRLLTVDGNIEGKQIAEVLRHPGLLDMLRDTLHSGEVISEEINLSKDGREMHLSATGVPIRAASGVSGIVLTLHNITRLRQLEEMRKDFVANVSHEIKTPLTAIRGFAETLLDGALEDKENALRFLAMIRNHSGRLNSLVDDLLTLSRIELGDVQIKKTVIELDQVVDTVFMTLRDKADRRGLTLRKSIPESAGTVMADRDKLIQIVLNLVDNGIKFTERGEVVVGLEEAGGQTALYVQDTGIGIPPKHLPRLGERFYRVDSARSRELGGTGLGLAIVKHIVHAHGWKIRIESERERGTRVSVLLESSF